MVIDVWVVFSGDTDRSIGNPTYFYSREDLAIAKAKGHGWYGGDAPIEKRKAFVCINNNKPTYYLLDKVGIIDVDDVKAKERELLRNKAKSKLTKEELEALLDNYEFGKID